MKEADLLHTCEDPTEHLGKETPKEAADILKSLEDKCNECDDQVEHTGILDLGRQHKLQQARNAARDVFVLHCTITCPDPTHPRTWGATVLAALGQVWWNCDQRAQMHRAYSAIQQLIPVHRFPTNQELRRYPRKRHPKGRGKQQRTAAGAWFRRAGAQ